MATKKQTALKVVNPLLMLLVINQVLAGTFHLYLSNRAFTILHKWGGFLFAALCIVHVVLNWSWIKAQFLQPKRSRKNRSRESI
jgi:hypothetical protein